MASLTALVALSIDAVLPAFSDIQASLQVERENSIQLVIGVFFAGMMVGYAVYGQLADAIGRKPTLYYGLGLYLFGCLISIFSSDLTLMLIGRFIQGVGVASPRIVTVTIVRDKFKGRDMAQVMSMIMGIFILIPVVAPSLGQFILFFSDWRGIFWFFVAACAVVWTWTHFRQEETLTPENRRPFSIQAIVSGFMEATRTRVTFGYSVTSGLAFSALVAYLSSSKQIFEDIYNVDEMFAIYFGILAMGVGVAFFTNSRLVKRYGMRCITNLAVNIILGASAVFLVIVLFWGAPFIVFMLFTWLCFFCLGLMFGNMGAMALEPMGHMAGLGSAYVSFVSTGISIVIGVIIGQLYNGTLLPMAAGFLMLGVGMRVMINWTEKYQEEEDCRFSV